MTSIPRESLSLLDKERKNRENPVKEEAVSILTAQSWLLACYLSKSPRCVYNGAVEPSICLFIKYLLWTKSVSGSLCFPEGG